MTRQLLDAALVVIVLGAVAIALVVDGAALAGWLLRRHGNEAPQQKAA